MNNDSGGLNISNHIKKEDAIDILDRTIGFISGCDNKTSVVISAFSILLTLFFSNIGFIKIATIIEIAFKSNNAVGYIYCGLIIISVLSFIFGLIKLTQVLFPKKSTNYIIEDGKNIVTNIYFGDISKKTFRHYKEALLKSSESEYLNDLIIEIYINSRICNEKYRNHKIGFISASTGLFMFIIVWGIGSYLY